MEFQHCADCGFKFQYDEDEANNLDESGNTVNCAHCHFCAKNKPLCGDHCYYISLKSRRLPMSCCRECFDQLSKDTDYLVCNEERESTYPKN
jgi:hypothetical protein